MPPRRRPPPAGARTDLPPLRIIRQILLLQVAYYVIATALILFTTAVYGTAFSFDLILSWDALRGDTTLGWMLGLVWMLNSFICVIFLLLLVSRSKLIPDFALTIHFLHLIATSLYTHSIPRNVLWWGLQFASVAFMTFFGMWACQWRELRPISFGGHAQPTATSSQPETAATDADQEISISRGRGRGRDLRAGSDEYEMVHMKGMGEQAV